MVQIVDIDERARQLVSMSQPIVPIDPARATTDETGKKYMAEWYRNEFAARKRQLVAQQKTADARSKESAKKEKRPKVTLSPATWDDYVGQSRLKIRLQVAMGGAQSRGEPIHPMLFIAPPGSGKTTIAELMADYLGVALVAITRPIGPDEMRERIRRAPADALLFVDECHQLPTKTEHVMMQVTEDRRLDFSWGTEAFESLNIVLATTEKDKVNDALRSRCQVVEWDPYSLDEMTEIVGAMASRAKVSIGGEDRRVLAAAASGVPRRARKFVSDARDMAASGLPVNADLILDFGGCTRDGLERDHLAYLSALLEMNGQAGLDPLCTRLRLKAGAVKEIERQLLDKGLVTLGQRGRVISKKGRRVLKETKR